MSTKAVIALAVVALFAGLLLAKVIGDPRSADPSGSPGVSPASPSLVRTDPNVVYAEALKAGRPIWVLFHSDTCPSCKGDPLARAGGGLRLAHHRGCLSRLVGVTYGYHIT
jgi:hypothetical protein